MPNAPFSLRLRAAILAAGVPIANVSIGTTGVSASVTVVPASLQGAAQPTIDAFDWSQGSQDAFDNVQARAVAIALLTDPVSLLKIQRAAILLILDEFNAHALKTNAILDAVDAALTLADLKARVALIADYPQRTRAQLFTVLTNKISAGDADA